MDGKEIKRILGASLKELRIAKGLTQEQLAELIGKQPSTINRIESGINFVNCDTLANLANIFNVSPSLLLVKTPKTLLKENDETIKAIIQLLQICPKDKIQDIYNILNAIIK